jgi:hypothetical protein
MLRQPIQIETGGVVSGGEALGDAQAVERVAAQGVGVEEVVQVSVADGAGGVGPAEGGAIVGVKDAAYCACNMRASFMVSSLCFTSGQFRFVLKFLRHVLRNSNACFLINIL